MRNALVAFALAALAAACQPAAPPAAVRRPQPVPAPGPPAMHPDTLARRTLALLRRYDLTPFWNDPRGDFWRFPVLEGFMGTEHRRLRLAITAVRRDPAHPRMFWVTGKIRVRRQVMPFTGTLTVTHLIDLQDGSVAPGESADSTNYLYTATAAVRFRPQGAGPAGELTGQTFFDFVVPQRGPVYMATTIMTRPNDPFPARGCGMVLRGHWAEAATGQQRPVLLAKDLFAVAPEVFPDFGIGDRGSRVNPKYTHLGWDEEWSNEEWWNDSPTPRLSL